MTVIEPEAASPSPWLSVWRHPRQTISRIVATDPRRHLLLAAGIAGIGETFAQIVLAEFTDLFSDWRIVLIIALAGVLLGIAALYIGSAIFRFAGRAFGGTADAASVRAAYAWSSAPYWLIVLVLPILALLSEMDMTSTLVRDGLALSVATTLWWSPLLLALMLARVQGFGFWRGLGSVLLGFVIALALAAGIAVGLRTLLFQPFSIPSASMVPALRIGDHILASKGAYGYSRYSLPLAPDWFAGRMFARQPNRGDIAVFAVPLDDGAVTYVKRIVGLPGDRIQMIGGRLHINGTAVPRERVEGQANEGGSQNATRYRETLPNGVAYEIMEQSDGMFLDNTREYIVPADHYFMLGDNRDNSADSRTNQIGLVPFENLIGRAAMIYYSAGLPGENPFRRFGRIGR